jgi:NADH-quinone oxidoreductase subunit J
MMLFLFVLMVVGVDSSDSLIETIRGQRLAAILFGLALGILLIAILGTAMLDMPDRGLEAANSAYGGNVEGLAQLIFSDYLLAFEATAALLITAALGALVLTHREMWRPKKSQRQLSEERFMVGAGHPGNKPNPGVYARHNAVNVAAILPDGSLALDSVPASVRGRDDSLIVDHRDVSEIQEITDTDESDPR